MSQENLQQRNYGKVGEFLSVKVLGKKLFLRKKLYHLRMEDGDSVTEHVSAFNTSVSELGSINITIAEEDKCITLLCSFLDS